MLNYNYGFVHYLKKLAKAAEIGLDLNMLVTPKYNTEDPDVLDYLEITATDSYDPEYLAWLYSNNPTLEKVYHMDDTCYYADICEKAKDEVVDSRIKELYPDFTFDEDLEDEWPKVDYNPYILEKKTWEVAIPKIIARFEESLKKCAEGKGWKIRKGGVSILVSGGEARYIRD